MSGNYVDSLPDMIIEKLYDEWVQNKSQEISSKLTIKLEKEYAIQMRRDRIKQIRNYLYIGILLALVIGLLVNQITYIIKQYINVKVAIFILVVIIIIIIFVLYFEFEHRRLSSTIEIQ